LLSLQMSNQYLKSSVRKMQTTNISSMIDSLAARFPVCMASDEFHFFPQARAKAFDWSIWDDFSPNALAETTAQLKDWEQQLDSHSKHSLSFDQEIDSSMMGRILRTLREQFELVRVQETQPTFYLTIIAIGLAEAIEAGLQAIEKRSYNLSRFVDQAIQNLISVPHLLREIGMEMLTEQQKWVHSLSLPEELSARVLNALQRLSKHLKHAEGADEFRPSVDLYERIAIEHMGCRIKPDDIAHELEMEIEETQSILTQSATAIASKRSWQAIIEELPRPPFPPGGILEIYRECIAELSRHCLSNGMITKELVEKCPVRVEPIPDYMRPVRSNAAYSMPPVHPPRGGTFYLQDADGGATLPPDYRLLTAHETFPGHHLLDTCRWLQERPARRHIEFPIFYEGWASFAEELMFETGLFSGPIDQMLMAKRRFWRAVRGKVDFDIHTRRRNLDQAADFLVSQGMAPHRAGIMVRRYSLKPGYQLAYTIGRRRFKVLYATADSKEKGPVAFARRILALGEIGFDHLEQVLRQGG
jgi:uncharacterized protein (DUF885 family)